MQMFADMKVAVITPYYNTPDEWLHKCYESVKAQTHPCTHILVADGCSQNLPESWDVQHIRLPVNHADYGDTPRGVGSVLAISQGFDAIAYLDSDNWFYPEHISTLVDLHQKTGAAVITSARNLHRLDGSFLNKCPEVDGIKFVDTNCYFLTRPAFKLVQLWWLIDDIYNLNDVLKIGKNLHSIADKVIWSEVLFSKLSHAHSEKASVAYRTGFLSHYEMFGELSPAGSKSGQEIHQTILKILKAIQERNSTKAPKGKII